MVKKINEMRELQKKKGKKGFSMIELIIIIAIMAILVALIGTQLIPYLEKSREKRDMTTLDTCKTAFESVVADTEMAIDSTKDKLELNVSNLKDTTAFESYAGLKTGDTPFKSKKAGTGAKVSEVKFIYKYGVLSTVKVGTLEVSTQTTSSK